MLCVTVILCMGRIDWQYRLCQSRQSTQLNEMTESWSFLPRLRLYLVLCLAPDISTCDTLVAQSGSNVVLWELSVALWSADSISAEYVESTVIFLQPSTFQVLFYLFISLFVFF